MTLALHGSYYRYNFGDTLLCRLFCEWLKEASPGEKIVVPLADERNRQLIAADGRGLAAAAESRGLLFCGGGYFSQPSDNLGRWSLRAYKRHIGLAELARARGLPYSIIGVGAGPLSKLWLRDKVRRVFDGANIVVVRDQESADFLSELGVQTRVTVAMDAVIGLTRETPLVLRQTTPEIARIARDTGKKVLLAHTACHPTAIERQVVDEVARWAASHDDVYVIFTDDSVSRRPVTWPAELARSPELAGRAAANLYDGNPEKHIALINSVDGVVTTKLHVGITGTTLEKPVISIPAHSKTPRFYRQVGLPDNCLPQSSDWRPALAARLDAWHAGAKPNFDQLKQVRASFSHSNAVAEFVRGLP